MSENAPLINARFLETDEDRKVTGQVLGRAREVVAQSPLADLVLEEEFPGPAVTTPEPVVSYILNNPVRGGLVQEWRDYPFSGSLVCEL